MQTNGQKDKTFFTVHMALHKEDEIVYIRQKY